MKLEMLEGSTNNNFFVDGKMLLDNHESLTNVAKSICDFIMGHSSPEDYTFICDLIVTILEAYGTTSWLKRSPQGGDHIYTNSLEI